MLNYKNRWLNEGVKDECTYTQRLRDDESSRTVHETLKFPWPVPPGPEGTRGSRLDSRHRSEVGRRHSTSNPLNTSIGFILNSLLNLKILEYNSSQIK